MRKIECNFLMYSFCLFLYAWGVPYEEKKADLRNIFDQVHDSLQAYKDACQYYEHEKISECLKNIVSLRSKITYYHRFQAAVLRFFYQTSPDKNLRDLFDNQTLYEQAFSSVLEDNFIANTLKVFPESIEKPLKLTNDEKKEVINKIATQVSYKQVLYKKFYDPIKVELFFELFKDFLSEHSLGYFCYVLLNKGISDFEAFVKKLGAKFDETVKVFVARHFFEQYDDLNGKNAAFVRYFIETYPDVMKSYAVFESALLDPIIGRSWPEVRDKRLALVQDHCFKNHVFYYSFFYEAVTKPFLDFNEIKWFLENGYDPNHLFDCGLFFNDYKTALDSIYQRTPRRWSRKTRIHPSHSQSHIKIVELLKKHGGKFANKEASLKSLNKMFSSRYNQAHHYHDNMTTKEVLNRLQKLMNEIGQLESVQKK